jgi:gliding motility-associated-like protein
VTINEVPEITLDIGIDLDLVAGDSVQLYALIRPPGVVVDSIVWSPANVLSCSHCLNPMLIVELPDTFFVTAIIYSGDCYATDTILVRAKDDFTLWVPNVFSPNGDDINDFVTVFSNDEIAMILEFEIFDRWGEKVFRSTNFIVNEPTLGWDGRFKGQYMNPAVFVYVAKVQFRNGVVRTVSGDITLLR